MKQRTHNNRRFLRRGQPASQWEEVTEDTAREKASQVLRDAVAGLPELEPGEEEEVLADPVPSSTVPSSTVSAQNSTDDADLDVESLPTPDMERSARDEQLGSPRSRDRHDPTAAPKRRRYSAYPQYSSDRYLSPTAGGVEYSPIRRHSESFSPPRAFSDPSLVPGGRNYRTLRPSHDYRYGPPSAGVDMSTGDDLGDLLNGDLLDSDIEDDEPLLLSGSRRR